MLPFQEQGFSADEGTMCIILKHEFEIGAKKNVCSWQSFICLHLKLLDIEHPLTFEVGKLRPMP